MADNSEAMQVPSRRQPVLKAQLSLTGLDRPIVVRQSPRAIASPLTPARLLPRGDVWEPL
jgi:hypothetical protein